MNQTTVRIRKSTRDDLAQIAEDVYAQTGKILSMDQTIRLLIKIYGQIQLGSNSE